MSPVPPTLTTVLRVVPHDETPGSAGDLPMVMSAKYADNSVLDNEVLVNQSVAHTEVIAAFRRVEADAAHKFGLIKAVAKKGPKAIQAAVETAEKAAKRRDSYAKKLDLLGVDLSACTAGHHLQAGKCYSPS